MNAFVISARRRKGGVGGCGKVGKVGQNVGRIGTESTSGVGHTRDRRNGLVYFLAGAHRGS